MSGELNVEKNRYSTSLDSFFPRESIVIILDMVDFTNPALNLALEDEILEFIAKSSSPLSVVRFWRNSECLVAGPRKSRYYGWYREDMARKMNVKIFTRSTGGGVVFHDLGNLNWSFYIKKEQKSFTPPLEIFKSAALMICNVLNKKYNVNACFAPPNRIDVNGYKISGMAARSTSNAILVHGTLLFRTDLDKLDKLCIPPPDCPPVTNLCYINSELTIDKFIFHFYENLKSYGYRLLVKKISCFT
ncbi:MAG TPA: lipoate--protein ligase family protein [Candidatus Caldiarchaeum subterraneum]|uniref:Lipoate--protein ligase family protein n=1 Tax=Caldiarchaeum subterraneum TaxID=311458 RepID=A0A833ECP6_CALS0|nr:lipoate--protein ligase family protein [Candidatus Caldarchaeum subterraneum]